MRPNLSVVCESPSRSSLPFPSNGSSRPVFLLTSSFAIFFFFYFLNLFMAVLGLRFCARAFSSCGERGPLFIAVRGPLTIAASPVAEHRLQMRRLGNCGSWAPLLCGMWDPPGPGLKPVSPALAGGFPTTAPPGKPLPSSSPPLAALSGWPAPHLPVPTGLLSLPMPASDVTHCILHSFWTCGQPPAPAL